MISSEETVMGLTVNQMDDELYTDCDCACTYLTRRTKRHKNLHHLMSCCVSAHHQIVEHKEWHTTSVPFQPPIATLQICKITQGCIATCF